MGFEPCKMEPDIWLRPYGKDNYEHIFSCVDELLIDSKNPKGTIDVLTNKIILKSKEQKLSIIILAVTLVVMIMVLCIFTQKEH